MRLMLPCGTTGRRIEVVTQVSKGTSGHQFGVAGPVLTMLSVRICWFPSRSCAAMTALGGLASSTVIWTFVFAGRR